MAETPNLQLILYPSSDWATTYYRDYILSMSGDDGNSNMQKIDASIGNVMDLFSSLTTFLSSY